MTSFKPNAVAAALICAGLTPFSSIANAAPEEQALDTQELEVIEVRGIRRSLEASQSLKMNSTSVVEAISAEDIGKLPDVSIAESLGRLPGVTTQRLNGRAQSISIRGMGGDFSGAQFNGREVVTTGDNRAVEYDQFPSELLNGVVVYKTPDAALIGQGLSGTVDMQTVSPLAHGEQALVIGGRLEQTDKDAPNPLGDEDGERLNATYIDQFMDNTLGVAIGFAHTKSPTQMERFEAWGYGENDKGQTEMGGFKVSNNSNMLERDSVMAIFEYEPNDRLKSTIDLFYSEFSEDQNIAMMESGLGLWSGAEMVEGSETVNENGVVTEATYTGVKPVVRNDLNTRDSDLYAFGWNTEYILNDDWKLTSDLAWSKVDRVDMNLETYAGTDSETDTMHMTMGSDGPTFTHEIDYSNSGSVGLTDSAGWGQVGFQKFAEIEDEIKQARFELNRMLDSDIFTNVVIGSHFIEREKTKGSEEYKVSGFTSGASYETVPVETYNADLSEYGLGDMMVYDPMDAINSGVYVVEEYHHPDITEKEWFVKEEITTLYTKVDIDTDIGDYTLSGNFGVQAVYTDQYSQAESSDIDGNITDKTGGATYWEFLPSINLNFNIDESQIIRVGLARTLARPRMDDLRASGQYSFDNKFEDGTSLDDSPWSMSGGNPELEPWIANAADVAYEYYFDETQGYVAVALFYKDLDTYIYNEQVVHDFSDYTLPDTCIGDNGDTRMCNPTYFLGYASTPQNGEGGDIKGVEFTLSVTGEMISEVLEGFGATMNASKTDSSIQPDPNNSSTPLPGLSEEVVNATLYYTYEGFEARISARYRSEFLGEVSGFGGDRNFRMIDEETVVDAQVSYNFAEGTDLEGLTLLLQAGNLTNEAFKSYENGDKDKLLDYQEYGKTLMLGATYSF